MIRYLVGRVLQTLLSMPVVISIVFVLTRLSGNPVQLPWMSMPRSANSNS